MTAITDPVRIGTLTLKNRLYRAPVLEGAGGKKDPAKIYASHFVPNAEAGVGLIIQGNTIVTREGRTSPGMSCIAEREDFLALAPMTRAVHAAGGKVVTQLGHGGLYALEAWHKPFADERSGPPIAASAPPWFLKPLARKVKVLSTAEVDALVERFGIVASWAREAGYDGVQLAAANAKLPHQFLSATYNRRTDKYGGDIEGRSTFITAIREAIRREAGDDYPVLLKVCVHEVGRPGGGITPEEGLKLARIAEQAGYDAITPVSAAALPDTSLCKGGFPTRSFENPALKRKLNVATGNRVRSAGIRASMWMAARNHPFEPVWNRSIFRAVKGEVSIPVFAVGGIRRPEEAREILASGEADVIGVGRPFYAEPALAHWFLAQEEGRTPACENCNRCIVPQMLGMPGVCYNPASQQQARAAK